MAMVPAVRLARRVVRLDDGHPVGISLAGRGMPLVVAHGFTGQGLLYVQTLSRLVGMGFKVIAIDMPGHGRTPLPRRRPADLAAHTDILIRALDACGLERAVLAGHSLGGRMVAEVAARDPSRAVALLLIDAIVGEPWDEVVAGVRRCPVRGWELLGRLAVDIADVAPLVDDHTQVLKLASLGLQSLASTRPTRLGATGLAILGAPPSVPLLGTLAGARVPTVVIHGGGDLTVPLATGRDTANRLGAPLVVVEGARHAWMLRDPEMLPAVVADLLDGALGSAWIQAVAAAGLDPAGATLEAIEQAMCAPGMPATTMTPALAFTPTGQRRRPAKYPFHVEMPPAA
jgi:pimeloyl-ACP methyl ester carboxylesterase